MKNKALLILSILLATCLFSSAAAAQSNGNYTITQSVIAGGGGTSSSGNTFSVTGTLGQSAAGTVSSNGNFSLAGGFWTAAPAGTIVISGNVTKNGNALPGVTVYLSGSASGSTTTDGSGYYEFTGLLINGTYTVTPSLANHVFSDTVSNNSSVTFTNVQEDKIADFIATQCSYLLTPDAVNVAAGATTGSFTVTAPAGCPWTAVSNNDSWLSVTSASPGSGNGTVNYSVAANSNAGRVGTITVAGQTFTVTQALGHSISGIVTYGTNLSKFVQGVLLSAIGTTSVFDTTDSMGAYQLDGLTNGGNYPVTPTKSDDINGISPFDATMILRHIAANGQGPNALNANQQIAADTSGDGNITPFDATLILRYLAAGGPNANTGQTGTWKFDPVSNPHPALNSSVSGENYTAILIGEINGDWTPPASLGEIEAAERQ
ncbi:MAG TPA: carboxypeptidase regulatory-like domain-containing protein [Pyrinomonadaceae bacterium]